MLKINKILSKTIKSPLSLRRMFPFCHSRESGNPSSLSLRGAKQRSNLKGFSLIELMVAAAILSFVIFGIFQAYSVGFMGMADARDRTVANNYLREMIEDFKNMDFNKVKDEPVVLIPGTKFHRGAIVLDLKGEGGNLKKVITQVRWTNREGNIKTEEASTILYGKLKTSEVSTAAEIILYAHTYYTILPTHTVELTAEIKDKNGNNITDWVGDITFSIIIPPNDPENPYVPVGYINPDPQTIHTTNGIAWIIFTAFEGESLEGIEKIQASADLGGEIGVVTDTVNIRVSTGAVSILLSPAEESLPKNGSTDITVTVLKADYETTAVEFSGEINLTASGPGNLSNTTITITSGVGTVTLISNGTPGVVEVTASAPDLDMGFTEVTFTGGPEYIKVSAENYSMHIGDSNMITVSIEDINRKEVNFVGTIELEITESSIGNGSFDPVSLSFSDTPSETSTFEASEVGSVIIKASDINLILTEGYTLYPINISEALVPHHIELYTVFPSVKADGIETSIITATVYDVDGNKVTNYSETITFDKDPDIGTFSDNNIIPDNGVATVELFSLVTGTTTVTVSSFDGLPVIPEGGVEVEFYGEAHHIVLAANPSSIQADGIETSTITATVYDVDGNKVTNYSETITFDKDPDIGTFSDNNIIPDNGVATVELFSLVTGTTTVTVSSSDVLPFIPVGGVEVIFTEKIPTELTLVPNSVSIWEDNIITFDIEITGAPLNLDEIQIQWNDSERYLNEIRIKSPSTEDADPIINTGNAPSTYVYIKSETDKDISNGISSIILTFNDEMHNRSIEVTFATPDPEESFVVNFTCP